MHAFPKIAVPLQHQKERDVAQLVAYYVRDVGVGRSNRLIPTLQDARFLNFSSLASLFYKFTYSQYILSGCLKNYLHNLRPMQQRENLVHSYLLF